MKTSLFSLASALLLVSCAAHAEQDLTTKTLPAKPGGTLKMRVDRGEIEIRIHSRDEVDVRVARKVTRASASEAKEIFQSHTIDIKESADGVVIEAERSQGGKSLGLFRRDPFNHLQVSYTITVPYEYHLDLRTAGGAIMVEQLGGDARCHTSGGDIRLGKIKGKVQGRTSGGSVRVEEGRDTIEAGTSGGDIRIHSAAGDVIAKTSGGSIIVRKAAGSAELETSGGDIRVEEIAGPVSARTSGGSISALLLKAPAGDCTLKTSGGSIELTLPAESPVKLMARTSGGRVKSDFPGEFNKRSDHYSAELNGGGPSVTLQTSGGNVEVKKR